MLKDRVWWLILYTMLVTCVTTIIYALNHPYTLIYLLLYICIFYKSIPTSNLEATLSEISIQSFTLFIIVYVC